MSIQHNFCFCSNEMQQSRIWRAKQNERNNYQNKNYRKLNQNYPKFQGAFLIQFTSIKSSIRDKNQETII